MSSSVLSWNFCSMLGLLFKFLIILYCVAINSCWCKYVTHVRVVWGRSTVFGWESPVSGNGSPTCSLCDLGTVPGSRWGSASSPVEAGWWQCLCLLPALGSCQGWNWAFSSIELPVLERTFRGAEHKAPCRNGKVTVITAFEHVSMLQMPWCVEHSTFPLKMNSW